MLAGCGSVRGQPDAGQPDAGQPDTIQPRCDPTAAFAPPLPIAAIDTAASEYEARLSPDELTIWLERDSDILVATRPDVGHDFGTPQVVTAVDTTNVEGAATITADGLTMYFQSDRPGGRGSVDIWVATRVSLTSPFSTPMLVQTINTAADEHDPYVTPDGSALYWTVISPSGQDVYTAKLGPSGFSAPTLVGGLQSSAHDSHIVVSADQLIVYWASDRSDPAASGSTDIWTAARASTSEPFGTPQILAPLNSTSYDDPTWISPDGCDLYLQSGRAGADLYVAHRP
jgi:hypothetical protein